MHSWTTLRLKFYVQSLKNSHETRMKEENLKYSHVFLFLGIKLENGWLSSA